MAAQHNLIALAINSLGRQAGVSQRKNPLTAC